MTDTLPSNKPNPPKGGFLWIFKARILECFGYTTAHGFGRVADLHDSWPRRWFWLLACAAAFGVFAYQFHDLTCQFLSRPLKTRTWIANHENLPFPQFTICNLNKIRLSKIPEEIKRSYPQILGGHGNNQNDTASNANNHSSTEDKDRPHDHVLKEKIQKRLAEYPESLLQAAGHQLNDMILKCEFNSMECLALMGSEKNGNAYVYIKAFRKDIFENLHFHINMMENRDDMNELWTQYWHPKYGNCYTFNGGKDTEGKPTRLVTQSIPGHDAGLKLHVNIEQYEYVSKLTDEAGARVFIGTQNEMSFPYYTGLSTASGYTTGIMLRKVVIGRLDPFANNSCEPKTALNENNVFLRYNSSYSDLACKVSCLATKMHQMCGCVYYTLKYDKMHNVCDGSDLSAIDCINEAYDVYSNGTCFKECREKCREEYFKMTVSAANWPSEHFKGKLRAELRKEGLENRSEGSNLSVNFLKLKVYYGELDFQVIEEEYAYPFSRFLSDVGGIMGMWVGISALTCVEALELIVSLFYTVLRRVKGQRVNAIEVQPRDSPA